MDKYLKVLSEIGTLLEEYGYVDEGEILDILEDNDIDLSVDEFFKDIPNKIKKDK